MLHTENFVTKDVAVCSLIDDTNVSEELGASILRMVPLKCWYPYTELHSMTSYMTIILILSTVGTSSAAFYEAFVQGCDTFNSVS
jgi:hypothetical protein